MEGLRGHMSGLGIPTYVVDSPHGGGKIPLMPNYLVSRLRRRGRPAQLRGHAGPLPGRGQAGDTASRRQTRGVSALLQGDKSALIPEGIERMARREEHGHGGCCGDESRDPAVLPLAATGTDRRVPLYVTND